MQYNCVVVDDEPLALDILENYIDRLEALHLVAKCQNALEAFEALTEHKVDLLFLDIQMPKMTGTDFLRSIKNPPAVIFTTAYRDYALESYDLDVVDYLLKPFSFERFMRSVNKSFKLLSSPKASSLETNSPETKEDAYMYVKVDKKMARIYLKDILYIESLKDYVRIKTSHKEYVAYQRISYLEEKLPEDSFRRVHRSYIISLDKIEAYSSQSVEINGKEIPIGRNYRNEVMKVIEEENL